MKTVINITGMSCGHCVQSVSDCLKKIDGVCDYEVTLSENKADVTFDPDKTNVKVICDAISDIGFDAEEKKV